MSQNLNLDHLKTVVGHYALRVIQDTRLSTEDTTTKILDIINTEAPNIIKQTTRDDLTSLIESTAATLLQNNNSGDGNDNNEIQNFITYWMNGNEEAANQLPKDAIEFIHQFNGQEEVQNIDITKIVQNMSTKDKADYILNKYLEMGYLFKETIAHVFGNSLAPLIGAQGYVNTKISNDIDWLKKTIEYFIKRAKFSNNSNQDNLNDLPISSRKISEMIKKKEKELEKQLKEKLTETEKATIEKEIDMLFSLKIPSEEIKDIIKEKTNGKNYKDLCPDDYELIDKDKYLAWLNVLKIELEKIDLNINDNKDINEIKKLTEKSLKSFQTSVGQIELYREDIVEMKKLIKESLQVSIEQIEIYKEDKNNEDIVEMKKLIKESLQTSIEQVEIYEDISEIKNLAKKSFQTSIEQVEIYEDISEIKNLAEESRQKSIKQIEFYVELFRKIKEESFLVYYYAGRLLISDKFPKKDDQF